jgi:uncharacterized membrane protein YadS
VLELPYGSAIAAISPVIKAEEKQISVALGTIFILNCCTTAIPIYWRLSEFITNSIWYVVLLQYMTLVQWLVPQVNTDLKH